MEDIRLGRESSYAVKQISVGNLAGGTELVPKADDRVALIVSTQTSTPLFLTPFGATPAANAGITLTTTTPIFMIDIEKHGQLVTAPWRGFCNATITITIIEVFLAKR